jgi:DNA-binding transcriptional MocR family regulator
VPGYDRHFAICEDFGIEMVLVPVTDDGPDMAAVEDLVAGDAAIKGMWCIPKYNNPTGTVYSDATIDRLAAMKAAAPDFRLWWDNAYALHHLTDDRIEIASIVEACARHGHANRPWCSDRRRRSRWPGPGWRCSGRRRPTSAGT